MIATPEALHKKAAEVNGSMRTRGIAKMPRGAPLAVDVVV